MFPGLNFFRKTRHQRFSFEPRYFDPDKEEAQERERRIKSELGLLDDAERSYRRGANIKGSFKKGASYRRDKAGLVRTLLVVFMVTGLILYWNFGNAAFYFLFVPVIFFYFVIKQKLI